MDELKKTLLMAFPTLDIRCRRAGDIHIITHDLSVQIINAHGGYQAKVVSLKGETDYDFETRLLATLQFATDAELVAGLRGYLDQRQQQRS